MNENREFVDYPSDDDAAFELLRQERLDRDVFDMMREDFYINKLTGGKGLPPDGLIEDWKHGRS